MIVWQVAAKERGAAEYVVYEAKMEIFCIIHNIKNEFLNYDVNIFIKLYYILPVIHTIKTEKVSIAFNRKLHSGSAFVKYA